MGHIMTEEQRELVKMVRDFAQKEVKPRAAEFDATGEFPLELLKKTFDMGLHMLEFPEEVGGMGLDFQTTAMMFEELAKADAGFAISLVTTFVAFRTVMQSGTEEQKQLFVDKIAPGGFGAFCLTEPDAGSDAGAMRGTAVRDGDEYVINANKCFITTGQYADIYVVMASTDKSKGSRGISAFIVEKDRPGITVGKHENKLGLRLSNTCNVSFDDVRVPVSHRIGAEGEGLKSALGALNISRAFVGTLAVGICQAAIDECLKYVQERKQFGRPIADFQLVQGMLADMEIQTEAARQLVQYAMRLIDNGMDVVKAGAITKCFCGDTVVKVTTDAIQVFGGYGVSREYPVEKLFRDSKVFQIFEGTNQIQRLTIAKELYRGN